MPLPQVLRRILGPGSRIAGIIRTVRPQYIRGASESTCCFTSRIRVLCTRGPRPAGKDTHKRFQRPYSTLPHLGGSCSSNLRRLRIRGVAVVSVMLGTVAFYFCNSRTVPITGRRRFNFLSDEWLTKILDVEAKEYLEPGEHLLPYWDPRTMMVRRVMKRLVRVSGITDLDWSVYVIEDDRIAQATGYPGGKVFVYSGIIDICPNEDALAALLAHEIAHYKESHIAEHLSAVCVANLMVGSLFLLAGAVPGLTLFGLWNVMGGYVFQDLLYCLPMSRQRESEADYVGLMMMAEACYDPTQAVEFWRRMESKAKRDKRRVLPLMSTHPSNEDRIANISGWMSRALVKHRESGCQHVAAFAETSGAVLLYPSTTAVAA